MNRRLASRRFACLTEIHLGMKSAVAVMEGRNRACRGKGGKVVRALSWRQLSIYARNLHCLLIRTICITLGTFFQSSTIIETENTSGNP